jgi:sugar phosphate isomerase/epimerase
VTPHPRLSVSAMCTFSWPFARDLALWSDLGLRLAGLLGSKLDRDGEAQMALLDARGITASTLIVEPFDLARPDDWPRTQAVHRAAIDLVARHGGHSIYFTPGRTTGARWAEDCERFARAVAPTVAHGRACGVATAIEPSLRTSLSFVNTLRDAIDVAACSGVQIVADFGNMWMERDVREVLRAAGPQLALVQIADVVIGSRASPPPGGRCHIGAGELPVARLIGDVLDAGYQGPFDLEVVAADYRADCDEADLRRGIGAASDMLYGLGL